MAQNSQDEPHQFKKMDRIIWGPEDDALRQKYGDGPFVVDEVSHSRRRAIVHIKDDGGYRIESNNSFGWFYQSQFQAAPKTVTSR